MTLTHHHFFITTTQWSRLGCQVAFPGIYYDSDVVYVIKPLLSELLS